MTVGMKAKPQNAWSCRLELQKVRKAGCFVHAPTLRRHLRFAAFLQTSLRYSRSLREAVRRESSAPVRGSSPHGRSASPGRLKCIRSAKRCPAEARRNVRIRGKGTRGQTPRKIRERALRSPPPFPSILHHAAQRGVQTPPQCATAPRMHLAFPAECRVRADGQGLSRRRQARDWLRAWPEARQDRNPRTSMDAFPRNVRRPRPQGCFCRARIRNGAFLRARHGNGRRSFPAKAELQRNLDRLDGNAGRDLGIAAGTVGERYRNLPDCAA